MNSMRALFSLFFKGSAVANPDAWKAGQVTATMIGALLVALVEVARAFFDVKIPLTSDQATLVGAGVLVIVNALCHVVRHPDVGLPSRNQPVEPPANSASETQPVPDSARDVGATIRDPGPG